MEELSEEARAELKRQANDAIWTHHTWVSVLKRAIAARRSDRTVEDVADPASCPVGAWLAGGVPVAVRASALYEATCRAHERFHREAAAVLADALAGQADAARVKMAPGSAFFQAAAQMRSSLYEWANVAQP